MDLEYEIKEGERDKLRFENQEGYYNALKIKHEYEQMIKEANNEPSEATD